MTDAPNKQMTFNPGMRSTDSPEWATPDYVIQQLRREFGEFTLDPCSTAQTAKAPKFYTKADNGLAQSWAGERVFMNPPYGRTIGEWIRKAASGEAFVVYLIPARTDTKWWHQYIGDGTVWKAESVRFWKGRIQFLNGKKKDNAPFPSAIVVFRAIENA